MKIIINIEKKHLYFLVGLIFVMGAIGIVIAQTQGVSHHAAEITAGEFAKERIPQILRSTTIGGDLKITGALNGVNGGGDADGMKVVSNCALRHDNSFGDVCNCNEDHYPSCGAGWHSVAEWRVNQWGGSAGWCTFHRLCIKDGW